MDQENIVSSRQPLQNLNIEDPSLFSPIFDKFDMFREVLKPDLSLALSFFYLEHLLRVSTDSSESEVAVSKLPEPLKSKFKGLYNSRLQILQGSIHALDTLIHSEDLIKVPIELIHVNYNWTGKKLVKQRTGYGGKEKLPLCYTLMFKGKLYILYTVNMTYIDGFDPFTGSTKIPMVTQGMIKGMSKDFYTSGFTSVEIQTEKTNNKIQSPKGSRKGSTNSALRNDSRSNMSKSPLPKESPRIPSPRIFDEVKGINEENESFHREFQVGQHKVEEEEEEFEEDDEEEEEASNSESLTFEKDLNKQLPGERTWEKYQKRAIEKQKERDQCAPGDCVVF